MNMTVQGSNSGGDLIFRISPHRSWGPPSCTLVTRSSPGVSGLCVALTIPSSAEFKERVEVHLYSSTGLSWLDIGRTFTLSEMCGACGMSGRVEWCTHGGLVGGHEGNRLFGKPGGGGAEGRIILVWMIKDIMDWMNLTVAAFCEHRFELCAADVRIVTVLTTVGLYLQ